MDAADAQPFPLEVLGRFVPRVVIEQVGRLSATEATAQSFPCAALLADISGFTALTERFSERGPAGVEELTRVLNDYFGRLVKRIDARGGDVVKFAGDALLAIWRVEAGKERSACWEAVRCAQELQQGLRGYVVEGREAPLRLRVGVATGTVHCMLVGGVYQRWELLLAGSPLRDVSAAAGRARPGAVVLTAEVAERLATCARTRPDPEGRADSRGGAEAGAFVELVAVSAPSGRTPTPPPKLDAPLVERLKAFVPRAIVQRIEVGQTEWLGERRRLTVLFIDIAELREEPALDRAQAILECVQRSLYRFEGSVNKVSVDDKGATLLAAFGLPPLSHEDDPLRGVNAALWLVESLRQMGASAAVGVTTGRVYCGAVGGDIRREYTVMGGPINLAARLMVRARTSGELPPVLVDTATQAATATAVEYAPPQEHELRGLGAVRVWRPLSTGERASDRRRGGVGGGPGALVGRVRERAHLSRRLEQLLRDRQGSVTVIEGEAGIGKSRLVEDLIGLARQSEAALFVGAADAIEKSTSYHAWRAVVLAALGLEPTASTDRVRERVVTSLAGTDRAGLAPLLNPVLRIDLPDNELTAQMSGEPLANSTRALILWLLRRAVGDRPVVLILDDLHWLDTASWTLLVQAVREIGPLMWVGASRQIRPEPPELSALLQRGDRLELGALAREETLRMVAARLGTESLPEPIARLIDERAEGHPFFSEELGYALRDAGVIEIRDGECRLARAADLARIDLPDNVEGIITTRIDRLSPREQLTLKVASVIGRVFSVDALEAVHPFARQRTEILEDVCVLADVDLTPLDSPAPHLAYLFKHVITQQVAYGLMLQAQRRDLHRTTAEWYERAQQAGNPANYALLAHHWAGAGDDARTIDCLERAALAALRSHANGEVLQFLEEAGKLAERAPVSRERRADWDLMIGQAKRGLGDYPAAGRHLEASLRTIPIAIPDSVPRLLLATLGEVARQAWHRMRKPAQVSSVQAARALRAANALDQLFMIYFFGGEELRMLYAGLAALNLAEDVGRPVPVLARAYGTLQTIAASIPLHGQMRYFIARARRAAEDVDQLSATSWVLLTRATAIAGLGEWDEAEATLHETAAITRRLGDDRTWCEATASLGTTTGARGAFDASRAHYQDVFANGERRGDLQAEGWGIVGQARCQLALGELDALDATLETCSQVLETGGNKIDFLTRFDVWAIQACRALRAGDDARARERLEFTVHAFSTERVPTQWMYMQAYGYFADAATELWARHPYDADARRLARFALRRLAAYTRVFPCGRPRLLLTRALHARIRGSHTRAHRLLSQATTESDRLAMRYEAELCRRHTSAA